jgi:hypothetical protein
VVESGGERIVTSVMTIKKSNENLKKKLTVDSRHVTSRASIVVGAKVVYSGRTSVGVGEGGRSSSSRLVLVLNNC